MEEEKRGRKKRACAVCIHRRQKCTEDCILAPYFPADREECFKNVLRCYTVSKLTKLLAAVEPSLRRNVAHSIIYETAMRALFPRHGCLTVIWPLQEQVIQCQAQLLSVRDRLRQIRRQHQQQEEQLPMGSDNGLQALVFPEQQVQGHNVDHHNESRSQLQVPQFHMQPQRQNPHHNLELGHQSCDILDQQEGQNQSNDPLPSASGSESAQIQTEGSSSSDPICGTATPNSSSFSAPLTSS